jgi:hypothetical protein
MEWIKRARKFEKRYWRLIRQGQSRKAIKELTLFSEKYPNPYLTKPQDERRKLYG